MNKINSLCIVFLLDSGSSVDGTFCKPALVTNVRPADQKIGMQTNVGVTTLDTKADAPGYGSVCLDLTHVTNAVTNADTATACFDPEHGLLMTTDTKMYDDEHQFVIASLQENKLFYTKRQFNDAHKACNLHHGSGRPSLPNLKQVTQIGWIKNNPCLSNNIT